MCAFKQTAPRPVIEGGTGNTSITAYSVLIGGITAIGDLQNANPTADTTGVLTSNGPGSQPSFQIPPIPQMNFQVLAADPASPADGQVWYNSTDDVFRGAKVNGGTTVVDFDVT